MWTHNPAPDHNESAFKMAKTNSIGAGDVDAAIEAVNDATDDISLKLYHLEKITQMVAFACEARRTLGEIYWNLEFYPDVQKHLHRKVEACGNWREYKDSTGEVMQQVAVQLQDLNTELSDRTQCIRELRSARMAAQA